MPRVRLFIHVLAVPALLLLASCQEKKADYFVREAREYTAKNCPLQLDEKTRLDSMVFVKDSVAGALTQHYTLLLNEAETHEFQTLRNAVRDENLRVIRNSVIFANQKDAGVTFVYIYRNEQGDTLAVFEFPKERYQ